VTEVGATTNDEAGTVATSDEAIDSTTLLGTLLGTFDEAITAVVESTQTT
jgi:hypothetical protein